MTTLATSTEQCNGDPALALSLQPSVKNKPTGVQSDIQQHAEKPRDTDNWKCCTLVDAYKPRPPLPSIFPGLAKSSLVIVYGAPATLKTALMADLAINAAMGSSHWLLGQPNHPGIDFPLTQCPAMLIDFDNGQRRTHERVEASGTAYSAPGDAPFYYYTMPSPWLDAGSKDAMVELTERVKERKVGLLVIDNLGAITGKADENSADMVQVMSNLRSLSEDTEAAVTVIHHQRKSGTTKGRSGESLRGHSSIEAAVDLVLLVQREEGSDFITVRSTKTRDVEIRPFGAQYIYEHKPDSTELKSARFYGVPIEASDSDEVVIVAIRDVVKSIPHINQSALSTQMQSIMPKVGRNRIQALAKRMASAGQLTSTGGKRGALCYDLP